MSEFLDYLRTWSVLKWVILVLIAGFIGQFGRMMAEALIRKARLKLKHEKAKPLLDSKVQELKPAGLSTGMEDTPSAPGRQEPAASDKKTVKALAKDIKKAAKAKNKGKGA